MHRVYKHEILMRQTGLVVFPLAVLCPAGSWWVSCGLAGALCAAGNGRAKGALAALMLVLWLGNAEAPWPMLALQLPSRHPILWHVGMPQPELPYAVAICTGTGA